MNSCVRPLLVLARVFHFQRLRTPRGQLSRALSALALMIGSTCLLPGSIAAPPRVLVPGYRLVEFAAAPQIVTPIALTFDAQGQLLVIESHTHHRPTEYAGPETDRIQRLSDTDGDGRADEIVTFFAGTRQTMSLLAGDDGWVYVATRRAIVRLRDTDGDRQADQQESIVTLDTRGDYPHNGLAGLAWTPTGELLFGMGENLGEPYRLMGSDGQEVRGEGEGGNVFVCNRQGGAVRRLATGFWNPFGNAFDPLGRLFTVDNDPDASPPCRLLHVVPGGDYGYQFRYGRSGRHPLQAWDAELPGTLPMAAGTGEAPCQIVPYRGRLWVTSWGDYRLEAYTLQPVGASYQAQLETVVQGDHEFRPVGLAVAPNGCLFLSDWVDRSYPVHGRGRIWQLIPTAETSSPPVQFPGLSAAEVRAAQLRTTPELAALGDPDPFIRQAAVFGWSQSPQLVDLPVADDTTPEQRLGLFEAWRWRDEAHAAELASQLLLDSADSVQIAALRVLAARRDTTARPQLLALLDRPELSDRLASVAIATLDWIDRGAETKDQASWHERLAAALENPQAAPNLRRLALRALPDDHPALESERLGRLLDSPPDATDPRLQREAIAILAQRATPPSTQRLALIALDVAQAPALRADATAALAAQVADQRTTLQRLAIDPSAEIRREAIRALGQIHPLGQAEVDRWIQSATVPAGDRDAGRRIFFRATGARCSVCHSYQGRGGIIGPELTTIHRRGDRSWLATAIIHPNQDVAPRYAAIAITLTDGRALTGLPLAGPGDDGQLTLVQTDGTQVSVPLNEIEQQTQLSSTIMPSGLADLLSREELSDLLEFLATPAQ